MEEELRQSIINYSVSKGVKYTYIAAKCNINTTTFCRWRKNQRNLSKDKLLRIEEFVADLG